MSGVGLLSAKNWNQPWADVVGSKGKGGIGKNTAREKHIGWRKPKTTWEGNAWVNWKREVREKWTS